MTARDMTIFYYIAQERGVAKGSSISQVAKLNGDNFSDERSEYKLSNGWSRSYRETKLLPASGK